MIIDELMMYVPEGKYNVAGDSVLLPQFAPHLPPSVIAAWMAAVSSVTPSPMGNRVIN
jgi:hypothetical protein